MSPRQAPLRPAKATLRKLRARYAVTWGREWPEGDSYLAELWIEARDGSRAQVPPPEVWNVALSLMRECHEFRA